MPTVDTGSLLCSRLARALVMRVTCAACSVLLGSPLWAVARADDGTDMEPAQVLALVSAGLPLRLTQHEDLGQDRTGPAFADALVGYVLTGAARYRHGVGLGVSTNLARDGHYVQPIYAGQQLVLMPAYLGYVEIGRDVPVLGHVGLPVLFGEGRAFGIELGAAIGYRLLAGVALFGELDVGSYVGARSTLSLLTSLELGVLIDYEVLP